MSNLDKNTRLLKAGILSRRAFLERAIAAGVTLPVALGIADRTLAAAPQMGGNFRQAITGGSTTDNLDPGQVLDMYMANVSFVWSIA